MELQRLSSAASRSCCRFVAPTTMELVAQKPSMKRRRTPSRRRVASFMSSDRLVASASICTNLCLHHDEDIDRPQLRNLRVTSVHSQLETSTEQQQTSEAQLERDTTTQNLEIVPARALVNKGNANLGLLSVRKSYISSVKRLESNLIKKDDTATHLLSKIQNGAECFLALTIPFTGDLLQRNVDHGNFRLASNYTCARCLARPRWPLQQHSLQGSI
jgi:hypothetical protein